MIELQTKTRDYAPVTTLKPKLQGGQIQGGALARIGFMTWFFDSISMEEMEPVALQNRVDTKFGFSISQLAAILPALQENYRILGISNKRLQDYQTLYFDTHGFDFFKLHVNQRSDEYKVRIRRYLSTNTSFLEVKHKNNKQRTEKQRVALDPNFPIMDAEAGSWVLDHIPGQYWPLEPVLMNTFTRLVFVDRQLTERVTVDLEIRFYSNNRLADTGQLVFAEVKRSSAHQPSQFLEVCRQNHLFPMGFSKYCLGVAMLYEEAKKNNLKAKLRWLEKVNHE